MVTWPRFSEYGLSVFIYRASGFQGFDNPEAALSNSHRSQVCRSFFGGEKRKKIPHIAAGDEEKVVMPRTERKQGQFFPLHHFFFKPPRFWVHGVLILQLRICVKGERAAWWETACRPGWWMEGWKNGNGLENRCRYGLWKHLTIRMPTPQFINSELYEQCNPFYPLYKQVDCVGFSKMAVYNRVQNGVLFPIHYKR